MEVYISTTTRRIGAGNFFLLKSERPEDSPPFLRLGNMMVVEDMLNPPKLDTLV